MSLGAGAHERPTGTVPALRAWIARLVRDRRGVAAVEFALIVPLLLSMYFVTSEVSEALATRKKVSRVGSMVADLVAQQQDIGKAEIDAIMAIGGVLLQPYNRSNPTITITAIEITDETTPKVLVAWSRKLTNGVSGAGATKG